MNYYCELQRRAKGHLRGYWLRAIVALCVYSALSAIVSLLFELAAMLTGLQSDRLPYYAIMLAQAVMSTIVCAPFLNGFRTVLWHRSECEEPSLSAVIELFGDAKRLMRRYLLTVLSFLITTVPAVALLAPAIIFLDRRAQIDTQDGNAPVIILTLLGCVLLIGTALCYYVYMTMRLFAADYIFIRDEELSAVGIIRRSFSLTRSKFKYTLALYIRFIPWMLLNLTGFAQLYVTPYFEMTRCMYIRDLIAYSPQHSDLSGTAVFDSASQGGAV